MKCLYFLLTASLIIIVTAEETKENTESESTPREIGSARFTARIGAKGCQDTGVLTRKSPAKDSSDPDDESIVSVESLPATPLQVMSQILTNPGGIISEFTDENGLNGDTSRPAGGNPMAAVVNFLNLLNPMNALVQFIDTLAPGESSGDDDGEKGDDDTKTNNELDVADDRVGYSPLTGPMLIGAALTVPAAIAAATGTDLQATAEGLTSMVLDGLDIAFDSIRREEVLSDNDITYDTSLYYPQQYHHAYAHIPGQSIQRNLQEHEETDNNVPRSYKKLGLMDLIYKSIKTYKALRAQNKPEE